MKKFTKLKFSVSPLIGWLLLMSVFPLLSACGQAGRLYLPPPPPETKPIVSNHV